MGGVVATAIAESGPRLVERVVVSDTPADQGLTATVALGELACWPVIGPAVDRFRGLDVVTESSLQTGFAADYPVPALAHRSLEQMTYTGLCQSDGGR